MRLRRCRETSCNGWANASGLCPAHAGKCRRGDDVVIDLPAGAECSPSLVR